MTTEQDQSVADKAAALDERLRLIEKQNAAEAARFGPAPKAKAAKAK